MPHSRVFRLVLLAGLAALLVGCVAGSTPAPGPTASPLPVSASATPQPAPALTRSVSPPANAMPPARVTEVAPQEAIPLPPVPAGRAAAADETPPFFLGVPAGDAYAPMSLAVDAVRGRAYVYHAESAEHRAVVSVVDLSRGQVVRVIRLAGTQPSGYGRVLLAPDGGQAYAIDPAAATLTPFDPETGVLAQAIPEISDAALSTDGRTLYALGGQAVRAFPLTELRAGNVAPIWRVAMAGAAELVVNGDRVLVSIAASEPQLRVLDAAGGRELAMTSLAGYPLGAAAGPEGGWAVRVGGDATQVVRFDRDLRPLGSAPASYGSGLYYDSVHARYLLSGPTPGRDGEYAVRALAAGDLAEATVVPWPSYNAPDVFAPYGDLIIGLNRGGPGQLTVFAPDLTVRNRITTGVRLTDLALDEVNDTLYVADDQGRVHLLALPVGYERATWAGAAPLALDAAQRRLYVNAAQGVQALDSASGKVVAVFPQRGVPAPAPHADLVYIADRGVTRYDRSGRKLGELADTFPHPSGLSPNPYVFAVFANPVTGSLLTIFNNGVPGSNNASYPNILLENAPALQNVPAPHSFVADLMFDAAAGDTFVSYSAVRGQEMIQRLAADGRELARVFGRTGLLGLDARTSVLYAVQPGVISGLDAKTLTLLDEWQGPAAAEQVALNSALRQLYVIDSASPRVAVLPLEGLSPLEHRPQPAVLPGDMDVESLAVVSDGAAGQWFFAAINGTPYRSRDAVRWEKLPVAAVSAWGYLTAAADGALFYAALSGAGADGVWRSTDFGETWALLADGLSDLRPAQAASALSADTAYFVGQTGGVSAWRTAADGAGGRWEPRLAVKSEADTVGQLALAPDGTLFLSRTDALRRSLDGGQRWEDLPPLGEGGELIGFSPLFTVTHTLYGAVGYGAHPARSTDAGKTWQPMALGRELDPGLGDLKVLAGSSVTYLFARGYGDTASLLMRSTDLGETWETADAPELAKTTALAVAPDGRLWLGARGRVSALAPEDILWSGPGRGVGGNVPLPAERPAATPTRPPTVRTTPHPTPTPYVTPCASGLLSDEAEIAQYSPELGCPVGDERAISMARQRFQHGQMLWLSADPAGNWTGPAILVLADGGALQWYADTYQEGRAEPVLATPAGVQAPVRGFGLIWRERLGGPSAAIGWAVEPESGVEGRAQAWTGGRVVRIGGEQYVLLNSGAWR